MTRGERERMSEQLNESVKGLPKPISYDVFEENRYVVLTLEFSPSEDRKRIEEYASWLAAIFKPVEATTYGEVK